MAETLSLTQRIEEAFSDRFDSSTQLIEEWITLRARPREIVILACSAIDSLANTARVEGTQLSKFTSFLDEFSGKRRELNKVAVPNLYLALARHYATLAATIQAAGRMYVFQPLEDVPLLRFVADSGLPVTAEDVGSFLEYFSRAIQRRYRTTATQARSKPLTDTAKNIHEYLLEDSSRRRNGSYRPAVEALLPLLKSYSLGAIIYREYRSGSIHELGFDVDERFFRETETYVASVGLMWDETRYLELRVPALWLMDLYKSSVENYKAKLVNTQRLPIQLYLDLCDALDELDFLDMSSLADAREVKYSVPR